MDSRNWISSRESAPTAEDADAQGCVVVWHAYNGVMVAQWRQVAESVYFTHWMRPPGPPEGRRETRTDEN